MRKPVVALSTALLASSAISTWLWRELGVQREINADLEAKLAGLPSLTAEPAEPSVFSPPAAGPDGAAIQDARATPVISPSAAPADAVEGPVRFQGTEKEWESQRRRLFQDAKYRDAWREERRLAYGRRRDNLVRLLGFTPEQADAVIELTVERELAWSQRQVTTTDMEAEEPAFQDQLRALLGGERHQRLQGYMESRASRMMVDQFRSEFDGADALRDDQIEPLIAALHVEHTQARKALEEYRTSLRAGHDGNFSKLYGERETQEMRAMHQRMHDAAAAVLTFSQLERLDAVLRRRLERHEHELRMNQLQRKVAAGNPPQPD